MDKKIVFCGCTIISENFILTAAHCLSNRTIDSIACIVGTTDYSRPIESSYASTYEILASIVYPHYDYETLLNDIALARTTRMQFNPAVAPICLPIR